MADLTAFATKDKSDEGVILPVMIDGMKVPMAIQIFGDDSDVVKEYDRKKIRKIVKSQKENKKGISAEEIDELLDSQDEAVVVRMGDIYTYDWEAKAIVKNEPVELNGHVIGNDHDSKAYLCEKFPAIKEWVMDKAKDRSNFLSAGKEN